MVANSTHLICLPPRPLSSLAPWGILLLSRNKLPPQFEWWHRERYCHRRPRCCCRSVCCYKVGCMNTSTFKLTSSRRSACHVLDRSSTLRFRYARYQHSSLCLEFERKQWSNWRIDIHTETMIHIVEVSSFKSYVWVTKFGGNTLTACFSFFVYISIIL